MRRVLIVSIACFPLVGAVAAPRGASEAQPVAVAARRQCRVLRLSGTTYRVTIEKGKVSCQTATKVLKDFLSGQGTLHGPPNGPAYEQTYTLHGWTCGYGTGGGGCIRNGKSYATARDYIVAEAVGRVHG